MNLQLKKEKILHVLSLQNKMFNPAECPDVDIDIQYSFSEQEGIFYFYISIRNKVSRIIEGTALKPKLTIISNLNTLKLIKSGRNDNATNRELFTVNGDVVFFMNYFRKMYGYKNYEIPDFVNQKKYKSVK